MFITCVAYALYILNHPYKNDLVRDVREAPTSKNTAQVVHEQPPPPKSESLSQPASNFGGFNSIASQSSSLTNGQNPLGAPKSLNKATFSLTSISGADQNVKFNAASLNPTTHKEQFEAERAAAANPSGFNIASLNPPQRSSSLLPQAASSNNVAAPPPVPTNPPTTTTAEPTPDPNCPETGCPPPSSTFGPLPDHWPHCDVTGNSNNVVFLKTHKTGSSTMSNIMLRYADTHNLTVGLPLEGKWELGGYPAYIDRRLIDPQLPTYNILGHHFRFNIDKLREFMPADTKYITILRSPIDNVESVFGFFQDQEPFIHWMESVETTQRLGLFYANPMQYFNQDTDWFFRSRNHMFFDNGLNVLANNDEYIDQQIAALESIYTFVLLTDYFDESLILMKHLLCWDWPDVVYVKFKMRIAEAKSNITPELGAQIQSWNHADVKLYDAFNKTFWRRVEEFGYDRMESMKYEFAVMQKKAEKECIDSYQPFKKKPWILGAKLKRNPSDYCKHLAWSETVYGEHLRDKMYATIPGLSKPSAEQKEASLSLFTQVAEGALRVT